MSSTQQFSCLYTKHKTQKRRVWHDGRLVVSGGRARLFNAEPTSADPLLDECDFSETQPMETERYLIQIEGPWVKPTTTALNGPGPSSHRPKILGRKFQPPQRVIPPLHRSKHSDMVLGKRKRPLQPGELEQLHYGSNATRLGPSSQPSASTAEPFPVNSQPHAWRDPAMSASAHHNGTNMVHSLPSQQHHHQQQQVPTPMAPSGAGSSNCTDRIAYPPAPRTSQNPYATNLMEREGVPRQETTLPSFPPNPWATAPTAVEPAVVPDAFVLHAPKTKAASRLGTLPFVSNNFNEQEYYGLEGEEEEEKEQENGRGSDNQENKENTLDPWSLHGSFHPFSTRPTIPSANHSPSPVPAETTGPVPPTATMDPMPTIALSTKPKSTDELFALFGTVPLIPTTTQPETTSHPTLTQTVDNTTPDNLDPSIPDAEPVRFYLPSPTNSDLSDQDQEKD